MALRVLVSACMVASASSAGLRGNQAMTANPIRRVVKMLQDMQKKIEAEGKRDEDLFDKYQCYCKNGAGDLDKSIQAAETKMPAVTSSLNEATAQKAQLGSALAQHEQDRTDAKQSIAEARALRDKEAATFAKTSSDYQTNIQAIGKAIDLVSKGAAGSFLQSSSANAVRRLTIDMDMSGVDRDIMTAFLAESSGYVPQSSQVEGILKQMQDTMQKDLADVTSNEKAAKANFEALVVAKEKEIASNSQSIETKTARHGQVGVQIEELREDLEDTSASYEEDKKFLADLDKNCATKEKEYEVVKKTRAEETLAIFETIKILDDDDALELFKKTLPSPSLLQTQQHGRDVRRQASKVLSGSRDTRLDLISLALHGKVNFDKVVSMIDDMSALLVKEQGDDDSKKAYCEETIDATEDQEKALNRETSDLEKAIEEAKTFIGATTEEIAALAAGIRALDESVAKATEGRKAENEEYQSTMAANTAAKELLNIATNRLNQFYNKALFKPAPKRELSREDRIVVNFGGTAPPTEAPGGIAGTGVTVLADVTAHVQRSADVAAPPPPPEAVAAYMKKGQESNGVLVLVGMLVADLDKEIQEMGVEEQDSQRDYEKFLGDSADKRRMDSKSIGEKEAAKAEAEAVMVKSQEDKKSTVQEAMVTAETLRDMHLTCDWLISQFQNRKDARQGEVESLKRAKAILSGADFA